MKYIHSHIEHTFMIVWFESFTEAEAFLAVSNLQHQYGRPVPYEIFVVTGQCEGINLIINCPPLEL